MGEDSVPTPAEPDPSVRAAGTEYDDFAAIRVRHMSENGLM
jgi:hypothetical protein